MDDLLDLSWDKKPQAASAARAAQPAGANSCYNFDALTRSLPSGSTSGGSNTPFRTDSPAYGQVSRAGSSQGGPSTNKNVPAAASSSSGDAFASLFAGSSGSGASADANSAAHSKLSLQERQKQMAGAFGTSHPQVKGQDLSWAGAADQWDSLGAQPKPAPPKPTTAKPSVAPTRPIAKPSDPFDFASFEDNGASQPSAFGDDDDDFLVAPSNRAPTASSRFDDSDDILGALSQPLAERKEAERREEHIAPSESRSRDQRSHAKTRARAASPPPHLIGQLVEMGFSPSEARKALEQTESGVDVQAAMEMLLSSGDGEPASERVQSQGRGASRRDSLSDEENDRRLAERLQREERQSAGRSSERRPRSVKEEFEAWQQNQNQGPEQRSGRSSNGTARRNERQGEKDTSEWPASADQIYTQASEIGTAMFSRANAFWNTAKASAAKALEEHRAQSSANASGDERDSGRSTPNITASAASAARALQRRLAGNAPSPRPDGRPKWMIDQAQEEEERSQSASRPTETSNGGGFKDLDDGDERPAPSFLSPRPGRETEALSAQRRQAQPVQTIASRSARLRVEEETHAYVSPARRAKSKPQDQGPPSKHVASQPIPRAAAPPANLRKRDFVDDPADAKSKAMALKKQGNEAFTRGSYGEAEAFYSRGIDHLPDASLRRIPLLNNRANARFKNGDSAAAMRDCESVMMLIVPESTTSDIRPYRPKEEAPLPSELAAEINLRDAWAKALLRKAQSAEALERWTTARKAWELLLAFEKQDGSGKSGVMNLRSAQAGYERCMEMITGKKAAPAPAARPSRASAAATARAEKAVKEKLAAQNAAKDAEDNEKLALKDGIDAKLAAWKGGKETNIRALLSSIDTLVWPELGWKKIGMHELVTDAQVKKNYTKAIAKLHPDKLNAKNTTLEQRLVANAVFSALNDAWVATQK